jgi:hypothetical protein
MRHPPIALLPPPPPPRPPAARRPNLQLRSRPPPCRRPHHPPTLQPRQVRTASQAAAWAAQAPARPVLATPAPGRLAWPTRRPRIVRSQLGQCPHRTPPPPIHRTVGRSPAASQSTPRLRHWRRRRLPRQPTALCCLHPTAMARLTSARRSPSPQRRPSWRSEEQRGRACLQPSLILPNPTRQGRVPSQIAPMEATPAALGSAGLASHPRGAARAPPGRPRWRRQTVGEGTRAAALAAGWRMPPPAEVGWAEAGMVCEARRCKSYHLPASPPEKQARLLCVRPPPPALTDQPWHPARERTTPPPVSGWAGQTRAPTLCTVPGSPARPRRSLGRDASRS